MRSRIVVLGSLLVAFAVCATAGIADAAPRHNDGLTINATPNPIQAGEGVLIYGQLTGSDIGNQTITLYHRVNPSHRFVPIGRMQTNSFGFYEFTRPEGLVYSNRSWFVRGPDTSHSRTIHEQVQALVSLRADRTVTDTRTSITFSGHVTPNHASQSVFLQVQRGNGDEWRTVASDRLNASSDYTISRAWRIPGARVVRTVLRRDDRNVRSPSDPIAIIVQQAQVPDFTISSSDPVIGVGQPATISGTLYTSGTKQPEPNTPVTLCGRTAGEPFACDTAGVTGADGSYRFAVTPEHNEVYFVETTLPPHRHTAKLFEGVRDAVSLTASTASAPAGQTVTFSGSVTPSQAGDTVYLQRLGADGDWHTVGVHTVAANSTFQFARDFGNAGTKTFRAWVLPDPANLGGASASVVVNITLPPVSTLPAAR
ncbi:MAG TPA: hypothetical protein VGI87_16700 [Solirubrobacteraceae bacterium]|jgi:hypothetical protein